MKIASATTAFVTGHAQSSTLAVRDRLVLRPAGAAAAATPSAERDDPRAIAAALTPTSAGRTPSRSDAREPAGGVPVPAGSAAAADPAAPRDAVTDPVLALIRSLVEYMTGRKMTLLSAADISRISAAATPELRDVASRVPAAAPAVDVERTAIRSESESTRFLATGSVTTDAGLEVAFTVSVTMDRSFRSTSTTAASATVRKDPLVINFRGDATRLEGRRFAFDLEGQGSNALLPTLAEGSGFLVFDRNGNGRVDDGSELFGPGTGGGFEELAALDRDGNGFVDAGDPSYGRLATWRPGDGAPTPLVQTGVAAIGTAAAPTPFALRDGENQPLGQVRSTGIWIDELGGVRTLQQIDLQV